MRKLFVILVAMAVLSSYAFSAISGLTPEIKNDLLRIGSNIVVPAGSIAKSAVSVGGNADIAGVVNKDAVVIGGNLTLRKTAIIHGDAVCIGGKLQKEPGAQVIGDTVEIGVTTLPSTIISKNLMLGLPLIGLASFISLLVLALFAVAFFSPQLGRASYYMERLPTHAFLWGLLMIVLVCPIIILLAVSLIGIIFIPAYLILLAGAVFFGYVAVSQLLGKKILKTLRLRNKPMMLEATAGLVLLALIGLIPVVGWLIKIIAATSGLGAVFATKFGMYD